MASSTKTRTKEEVETQTIEYEQIRLTPRITKKNARPLNVHRMSAASKQERQNWNLTDFVIKGKLGSGNFGDVYRAKELQTGYPVALKILRREDIIDQHMEGQLESEIEIQLALSAHKNVLRMYGFFWDDTRIYLILELATGGMLHRHLGKAGRFSEPDAAGYVMQIARALQFTHGHNVIHRDLKPENLLLDENGVVKLADFGWSSIGKRRRNTLCGTLDFLAPEMCMGRPYGSDADIWSLGVIMYEMLYGRPPFQEHGENRTFKTKKRIMTVDFRFPDEEVVVSKEAKRLIIDMLRKEPYQRISLRKILRSPWIQKHTNSKQYGL